MGILLLNLVFHILFNTPYLLARTAIVFYFPLVLCVLAVLDDIRPANQGYRSVAFTVSAVIAGFLIIGSIKNLRSSYDVCHIIEWPTDLRKGLDYLNRLNAKKVGLTRQNKQVFDAYYALAFPDRYKFERRLVTGDELHASPDSIRQWGCDYLFLTLYTPEKALVDSFAVIQNYPATWTVLLKVK